MSENTVVEEVEVEAADPEMEAEEVVTDLEDDDLEETDVDPEETDQEEVEIPEAIADLPDELIVKTLSDEHDEDPTDLDISLGQVKYGVRTGQFKDPAVLAAIVDGEILTEDEIRILQAFPIERKKEEQAGKKSKKSSRSSSAQKEVKEITELLRLSPVGLTVEEICVELGALTPDADPTDSDVRDLKKKFRGWCRAAVDKEESGDRTTNLGRNRLYSIGEVRDRGEDEDVHMILTTIRNAG